MDLFPDNRDAPNLEYCGTNIIAFWKAYLLPWVKAKREAEKNNVLFCPTDRLHRLANVQEWLSETRPVFCGYFLLPNRVPYGGWDYKVGGIEGWHFREKLGGEFVNAPVLTDHMQAAGFTRVNGSIQVLNWLDTGVPSSSHSGEAGRPTGGNFLFEDGHVAWYKWPTISLGSAGDAGYLCFYKISIDGQ